MKITMTADADHRISGGKTMCFRNGRTYPRVPRPIGEALISRGVAISDEAEPRKSDKEAS